MVLLKKTNDNTKITKLENKIPDICNLATKTELTARENKTPSVSDLVKKTDYNTNITDIENNSFWCHFEEDGTQNHLVFQPIYRYFKLIINTLNILLWQSKGLSNENFDSPNTNFSPSTDYVDNKIRVKFNGSCLKQSNKISYTHKKIVNIYIVYEINVHTTNYNYPTLENCLFGAVTLTKNTDIDK